MLLLFLMDNQNNIFHGWSPAGAVVGRGEIFPLFPLKELSAKSLFQKFSQDLRVI